MKRLGKQLDNKNKKAVPMGRYQTLTVSSAAFYQNHACKKKKEEKKRECE